MIFTTALFTLIAAGAGYVFGRSRGYDSGYEIGYDTGKIMAKRLHKISKDIESVVIPALKSELRKTTTKKTSTKPVVENWETNKERHLR